MLVSVKDISKSFAGNIVLDKVSFDINEMIE